MPLQFQFLEQVGASLERDARDFAKLRLEGHRLSHGGRRPCLNGYRPCLQDDRLSYGLDRAKPGHDRPCRGRSLAWVEGGDGLVGRLLSVHGASRVAAGVTMKGWR